MSGLNNNNPNGNSPNSILKAIAAIVMPLGVGIGLGLAQGFRTQPPATIPEAQYERIEPGMSITDVRAIAGDGVEVRRSASETVFEWYGSDGQVVQGTFDGNTLTEKTQSTHR